MTDHSSLVGGSNAEIVLNCDGYYQATIALPRSVDVSSEYAEEGTAMHAVMTALMRYRSDDGRLSLEEIAQGMLGQTFHDRVLTQAHLDTMIYPALQRLYDLEEVYDSDLSNPFEVLAVEKRVKFPRIPGAFGTCDVILGNDSHMLHIDWKFGQGVGVKATYADPDGRERVNAQLMFYVAGSLNSARRNHGGKQIVVAIIQPRGDTPLSHVQISRKEVKWFVEDLEAAVIRSLGHTPKRTKGEWCRWAPCKVACPLWTGPLLDLSALNPVLPKREDVVSKLPTPYADYLARAKQLVDMLALYSKEVNEQLHAYLEDGGVVPGWRLKAKAKQRQWANEDVVLSELQALGFEFGDIMQYKLKTFAATDATARKLGVTIPDHLRVAPPTNETTVCRDDDPAPPVERQLAIEQFRASLAALKQER